MKTKQEVKLLYISPLSLISNAIRYSHYTFDKSDTKDLNFIGKKDLELIKKIGFKLKHESVLEHSIIVFHLKLSQKALLEATRHRIGISWTVTSSRYALRKINIENEFTGDNDIDNFITEFIKKIKNLLENKKPMDIVSKLLPQSFLYTAQVTFNLRSLINFLKLRLNKNAHRDIRIIAYKMFEELPNDYKQLILVDETINKNLNNIL